ncbi:S24 family peptidase [Maritimibacter sp. 55A14]|uniref:LexA family transcriptional regulator n=1 Tax=Maritimibacter sp. 55A14 TaxID=2174844 RepID=UPI001304D23D|nr:S24 family peptidase [Maritimibacter sp. 55A14]
MELDELLRIIENRRSDLGLTQAEVAARAGRASSTGTALIQNIRRGKDPTFRNVNAICDALGLELHIGPARRSAVQQVMDEHGEPAAVRRIVQTARLATPPAQAARDEDHFATIPRFEAELAAGAGRANGDGVAMELLAFRRDWLRQMGVTADKACLLKVRGDSMAPTLQDGDLVLVDRSRRDDIRDDRIYAFTEDGEARVKRLLRAGGELLLQSDNAAYPTERRKGRDMNRLNVLGEVVWSGHELR